MMDVRLITTNRSAPAISTPPLKAKRITASIPNRNSATANEHSVSTRRIFLRNRLARISPRNFIAYLHWKRFADGQLPPARLFPDATVRQPALPRRDRAL